MKILLNIIYFAQIIVFAILLGLSKINFFEYYVLITLALILNTILHIYIKLKPDDL